MREIKFRGIHKHVLDDNKHLDGKWIYGYLSDKSYINSPELEGEFLIDENTVGQFTGLHDKNGKEIYEGDVIDRSYVSPLTKELVINRYIIEWDTGIYKAVFIKNRPYYDRYLWMEFRDVEVIGNIYDNPDLLKEDNHAV